MSTTAPYRLVDVDDLEDGDLAARIAEIGMPPVVAPRRLPAPPAARQAEVDAVVTAWTVVRDRRTAVHAHGLGASAAALLA
ncbi:hypothetical protein [Trujillonella humicola]|uniref:hypothetical protein n=1 Tax=Trujillonella humicola TaxID=3383699 RepID=UPI003906570D